MRQAQKMLLDAIKTNGEVRGEIVKVDRILNHMVDTQLIKAIGKDIAEKFKDTDIDVILTVEASGIAAAQSAAMYMDKNFIFAKKKNPITMKGFFCAESYSFTKNETTTLYVSKEVLNKGDRVLFVDDFFAKGNTLKSIINIIGQAEAELAGVAVVIDKQNNKDIHSIVTLNDITDWMK